MPQTEQTFTRLNTDDADVSRPASDFTAATNIALELGGVRPHPGNVAVPYDLPSQGINKRLGGFTNGAAGTGITLLYNSTGKHRIIRYDPITKTETTLLEWDGLHLQADTVPKGGVVDGILVFLDGRGELRSMNLKRAENNEYTPALLAADPYVLHVVKQPPAQAPIAFRIFLNTADPNSTQKIIQDKAYQFCMRWRYLDGEVTPLGPRSVWLDVQDAPDKTQYTAIDVRIPGNYRLPGAIPPTVSEVEVLVRQAGDPTFKVAKTLRRTGGILPTFFGFYGVNEGLVPTASEQAKPFESLWPANDVVIGRSRLIVAGLLEGYKTPQPAFSAAVQVGELLTQLGGNYLVFVTHNFRERDGINAQYRAYMLSSDPSVANYPSLNSTYKQLLLNGDTQNQVVGYAIDPNAVTLTYTQAFVTPEAGEVSRTITPLGTVGVGVTSLGNGTTFLPRSSYQVAVQYYDAQGRQGGASNPVSVFIPATADASTYQRIRWNLLTNDATALNAEIPAWASTYHIVVGPNARASWFAQGRAADVLAYFGDATSRDSSGNTLTRAILRARTTDHNKLWVDIGNWPGAGQGYTWDPTSGDVLRFLADGYDCKITDQRGDYVEVVWQGAPVDPEPLIEIYTPIITVNTILYERGQRYKITRTVGADGSEQRGHEVSTGLLDGDCCFGNIYFPSLASPALGSSTYDPPTIKSYVFGASRGTNSVAVIRRVPIYRSIRGTTPTANGPQAAGLLDGSLYAEAVRRQAEALAAGRRPEYDIPVSGIAATQTFATSTLNTAPGSDVWLDMSWGGRPTQAIPVALQQVYRHNLLRYSGTKVQGTLINGLSQWDSLNQYEELPQEQGPVLRLTVADQTQTDGTVLLVNQRFGATSLSLGRGQIQTADGTELLTITKSVIGSGSTLRGGFGCVDPASVVAYAGKVFFWCAERADLLRYDRNGLTPVGLTYKARTLLGNASAAYAGGQVTACYNPFIDRKELYLTFHSADGTTGTTLVYSDLHEAWSGTLSFVPESGMSLGSQLLTFLNGGLWVHSQSAPVSTFFGIAMPSALTFTTANPGRRINKIWRAISVHSNGRWLPTSLSNSDGQASRVLGSWLKYAGGIWRAALRRDENTGGPDSAAQKLHSGAELQSVVLQVTLTADPRANELLTACEVEFIAGAGQRPNS